MDLVFSPLFSGSSGNATYVGAGDYHLLVDAGVSCSRIIRELQQIGVSPGALSAILITHEHTDHISGAGILSRRFDLPIYATCGTWRAMEAKLGAIDPKNMRLVDARQDFFVGGISVTPFALPHDACEPCGYTFTAGGAKASVATDIGCVKDGWMKPVEGSDILLLESNYDPGMLKAGRYPYSLKTRILGKRGHLSNEDAARAAVSLALKNVKNIILGHLSNENNFPELAWETTAQALSEAGARLEKDVKLFIAPRDKTAGVYTARGYAVRRA